MAEYIVSADDTEESWYSFEMGRYDELQELIRCKDCKYYKVYELFNHTIPLCDRIKTTMADALEEDDYCSRAEREEE